jgi:hypothetical protein
LTLSKSSAIIKTTTKGNNKSEAERVNPVMIGEEPKHLVPALDKPESRIKR